MCRKLVGETGFEPATLCSQSSKEARISAADAVEQRENTVNGINGLARKRLTDGKAERKLIEAVRKLGLRELVAGWNGENRADGPYEPNPAKLGVTLRTNAGTVYEIDRAIEALSVQLAEAKQVHGAQRGEFICVKCGIRQDCPHDNEARF